LILPASCFSSLYVASGESISDHVIVIRCWLGALKKKPKKEKKKFFS